MESCDRHEQIAAAARIYATALLDVDRVAIALALSAIFLAMRIIDLNPDVRILFAQSDHYSSENTRENFSAMELFWPSGFYPISNSGRMRLNSAAPQCALVTVQSFIRIASSSYSRHGFITLTRFSLVRIGLGRCI